MVFRARQFEKFESLLSVARIADTRVFFTRANYRQRLPRNGRYLDATAASWRYCTSESSRRNSFLTTA